MARFDGRNPRAEAWLTERSSRLIVEIVEEQRDIVRAFLTDAMRDGRGPRSAALDIVGRINRATGRREGGIIGLTKSQQASVQTVLDELRSGDPGQMANYLKRKLRDRRFDPTVIRALREGTGVKADAARKIAGRYSDRLLRRRGETIARTELIGALHEAQDEGLRQLVDRGALTPEQITRTWDATEDSDTRDSHRALDGQTEDAEGVFTTINGHRLRYPGDRALGAPAGEIINCRCRIRIDIDYLSELRGDA